MFNGLQQQLSSRFGLLWSGVKSKVPRILSAVSKVPLEPSVSTAGTLKQQIKVPTLQPVVRQTGRGQERLSPFNNPEGVATMSNIFAELAALAASEAFPPVLTLVNSTLADIETNPQEWVNPASATIKGTAFVANLVATLPTIENAAVPAAAQLVSAIFSTLAAKLTAAGQVTPAAVGAEIANTIVSRT
jgi:hypothetical protein